MRGEAERHPDARRGDICGIERVVEQRHAGHGALVALRVGIAQRRAFELRSQRGEVGDQPPGGEVERGDRGAGGEAMAAGRRRERGGLAASSPVTLALSWRAPEAQRSVRSARFRTDCLIRYQYQTDNLPSIHPQYRT